MYALVDGGMLTGRASTSIRCGQRTLGRALTTWAVERGERPAFTFVDYGTDPAGIKHTVSWAELDRQVKAVAVCLREATADTGARVAILAPQGLGYVVAFLACLQSNMIGVPLFPPDTSRHGDRLVGVLCDCEAQVILTTRGARSAVKKFYQDKNLSRPEMILAVDTVDVELDKRWRDPKVSENSLAYLQYTSGSTSIPAGVMISHENLIANCAQIVDTFELCAETTFVNWAPFFHDMGLVLGIVVPAFLGVQCLFMTPFSFVQQPVRWMQLLATYPNVFGAAPNFAYDYAVERFLRAGCIDETFASVHTLINGAEPVRADTIEKFNEIFMPRGLRAAAQRPAYGLAEATLVVTGSREPVITTFDSGALRAGMVRVVEPGAPAAHRMVSCGSAVHQQVRIVDPDNHRELPGDRVGEIWVNGPNVGLGYWRRPEQTAKIFRAQLKYPSVQTPAGPWLRTGDLGFFYEGHLYIAGRRKDLIIVDGENHCPQDIEVTVQQTSPVIRRERAIAFGVEVDGAERVVVVAEVDQRGVKEVDWDALMSAVSRAVLANHNVRVHEFVPVRVGGVPRTSSGKVQRALCRTRYLAGDLPSLM